jgi:hypothetical protein
LKISRREKVTSAILISISLVLTAYTASAYYIASYIHEFEGILTWPSPGYSFFPWPHIKTGIFPAITVPLNQIEIDYYNYIIKSGILIALTSLMWILVSWRVWKLWRQNKVS